VLEVLAAFVREHSLGQWPPKERGAETPGRTTRPGVLAAVVVIGAPDPQARPGGDANLEAANLTRANLTGAPWRSDAGVPRAGNETPTRAAGSRPILTWAVRQQTCYALTGLPCLPSGICTGASSRHGMAGSRPGSRDLSAVRRLVPW
jgi:hypothetical protein